MLRLASELREANSNNKKAAKSVKESLDLLKRTLSSPGDALEHLKKVETSLQKLFENVYEPTC
jgi:hypothetical protein